MKETWTEEATQAVAKLWSTGVSSGTIAKQLGISRNAVIGRMHRLGIQTPAHRGNVGLRASDKRRKPRLNRSFQSRKPRPERPQPKLLDSDIPLDQRRGLLDLDGGCKWPVGHPPDADFFFCGGARADNRPYCYEHCLRAYEWR